MGRKFPSDIAEKRREKRTERHGALAEAAEDVGRCVHCGRPLGLTFDVLQGEGLVCSPHCL